MTPLVINVIPAGTTEEIRANVSSALARSLPELVPALVSHDGPLVCVASGPSTPQFLESIKRERERGRPILAVKGAHDYLCRNGVVPDLWIGVDPRDCSDLLEEVNDHTTYLVASRCSPLVFDTLKGRRVVLVHCYAEEEPHPGFKGKMLIGGGSTSGLRGISAGYALGFRNFILYGYDSCLADDRTTKRFTGEKVEPHKVVDVIVDGRRFWANGAMAQQANEFQQYYQLLERFHVEVHGDGLIAAIVKARAAREFAA